MKKPNQYPKMRLLENRVLLEILDEEMKSTSGIIILKRSQIEGQIRARVILVGDYCDEDLHLDDIVYIREDSGSKIQLEEGKFFVTRDINVLAIEHPRAKDPNIAIGILKELVKGARESDILDFRSDLQDLVARANEFLD